jgi:hypothetical protein
MSRRRTPSIGDQVELFLRRRQACEEWGCSPEEAVWLDTPRRWKAWRRFGKRGTAPKFFERCRLIMTVFRVAVDRRQAFWREVIVPQGRWQHTRYEADRCAIIAGDAIVGLLPFPPDLIACVAEDAMRTWPTYATTIAGYVTWADAYRKNRWYWSREPQFMANLYKVYARKLREAWGLPRAIDDTRKKIFSAALASTGRSRRNPEPCDDLDTYGLGPVYASRVAFVRTILAAR